MNLSTIFKNINFYEFQYQEGYFCRTSSFIKEKDKPNKLYEFELTVFYCKCCDVLKSIKFIKNNNYYSWNESNKNPDKFVNYEQNGINYIFCSYGEIISIIKENC